MWGSTEDIQSSPKKWILLMIFVGGSKKKYNEPIVGKTRLVKEIFLLKEQAKNVKPMYEFRADKYGPNSIKLLQDIDELKLRGLINEREIIGGLVYTLTPRGVTLANSLYKVLNKETKRKMVNIKTRFNSMSLNNLLNYVYTLHSEYAERSIYEEPME